MKKQLLILLVVLLASQSASCASVGISIVACDPESTTTLERIEPNSDLIAKLKVFHDPTSSADRSPRPDMTKFQSLDRRFIAKMDCFGFDKA